MSRISIKKFTLYVENRIIKTSILKYSHLSLNILNPFFMNRNRIKSRRTRLENNDFFFN